MRIFIDLNAAAAGQGFEAEDHSLSSEEEEEEETRSCCSAAPSDEKVIVIDDSPVIQRKQRNKDDKLKKYRKMAKAFKTRVSMLEGRRKELNKEKQALLGKLEIKQKELDKAVSEFETLELEWNDQQRSIETLKLQTVQQTRQLTESKTKILEYEQQTATLKRKLQEVEKESERRSARQMKEVQRVLEEQPKIVNENRLLKDQIRNLEQRLKTFQHVRSGNECHDARSAAKLLRQLNQQRNELEQCNVAAAASAAACVKRQEQDKTQRIQLEKLSQNTVRLSQAIRKSQKSKHSTSLNVLNSIDHPGNCKTAVLEPEVPVFLKTAPSKRKPVHQNPSLQPTQRKRLTSAAEQHYLLFRK
jgi:chromosome segregation ATPase